MYREFVKALTTSALLILCSMPGHANDQAPAAPAVAAPDDDDFQEKELAVPIDPRTGQPMDMQDLRKYVDKESSLKGAAESKGKPFVSKHPYVPQLREYGIELGGAWTRSNLYWVGVTHGRHIGKCILSDSETCQQFFDITGGMAGRDAQSHYLGALSLRWQFVNFPKVWSPFTRFYVGGMHSIEPSLVRDRLLWGVGTGFTTYLHPQADLRVEVRTGFTGQDNFSQLMVSAIIKLDKILEYFVVRLAEVGYGTVKVTGTVVSTVVEKSVDVTTSAVKATAKGVKTVGGVVGEVVQKPFTSASPAASPSPTASATPTPTPSPSSKK